MSMLCDVKRERRFLVKWHLSCAIPKPRFEGENLEIIAIGDHYEGRAAGFQTLSLGERIVSPGVTEPVIAIVVPAGNFELGQRLYRLPGNYIPIDAFFGND